MGKPERPAPSRELVDEIANTIRREVSSGRYPMGLWLRQEALAADFGVSRTPIREALRKLQAEGLIVLVPRRGALVRGPTPREIREAYQVRAELEGLAAKFAAAAIADEELRSLARAERRFHALVDDVALSGRRGRGTDARRVVERWIEANDSFHDIVQRAANNEQLRQTILFLHRAIPRGLTGMAFAANTRLLHDNAAEHAGIHDAIANGGGRRAQQLMREHILRSGEIAASWFELHETRARELV
jgi:DNA-binding GntR family transcriptional regulator